MRRRSEPQKKLVLTSLSIRRTCRQIHDETAGLLWAHNTLFISSSSFHSPSLGVLTLFKSMGQTASRQITSVQLNMPFLIQEFHILPKPLHLLLSRSRHGCFRKLELVWGSQEFDQLVKLYERQYSVQQEEAWAIRTHERMLEDLREGMEGCRYERVVRMPRFNADGYKWNVLCKEEVLKAVHLAVGGSLWEGEKEVWRDYRRVVG
jgi:hypothetical protein